MTDDGEAFELLEATIADIHDAIAAGQVTVEELCERYLARIEEYDGRLNAVLTINEAATERARALDRTFESEGFVGPLHGVPVLLKDNQDTHDMPTTAGSKALAGSTPARDAFVVEQLRDAGAVVLGKANLQELSFGVDTISSLGGATRNAYAHDRRPSGSSGGTAAAVAANLAAVGTGSDTCSSVRSPPAYNNLVGLRPTRGLLSRSGIVPLSETQDTAGPIARTVADAARLLEVMAGYDPDDPVTAAGADQVPADGYTAHLDAAGLEGARIGVPREFFGLREATSAPESAAGAVTAVVDEAIEEIAAAGGTVVDPVEVVEVAEIERERVIQYEFARDFGRYLSQRRDDLQYDSLAEVYDTGTITPSVEARLEESGILATDTGGREDGETDRETVEYLDRLRRRGDLRTATLAALVEHDLDALLYPAARIPPVEIPAHQPFAEMNCELAAHTGLPAIVVPAGFTDEELPVGLELLGRPFAEPRLFELAYGFEQSTGHRRPPEAYGELADGEDRPR